MSNHHNHGSQSHPSQQESPRVLAYHLWEKAGRPEGQSARFWGEAEEQIKRSRQPAAASLHLHHGQQHNAL